MTAQTGHISGDISSSTANTINDVSLSFYTACCTGCPAVANCTETNLAAFFNKSLTNCQDGSGGNVCAFAETCTGVSDNGCYTTNIVPSTGVDQSLCTVRCRMHARTPRTDWVRARD